MSRHLSDPNKQTNFFFINSKLKEKDKWLYYDDDSGWGNLVPRKEFNKEEFINEFTYAYEDI